MITLDFAKTLQGHQGEFVLKVQENISAGERIGIFGPSGAGKSTILRILSGLSKPDSGEIIADGEKWNASGVFLPPQKRHIGFVFQDYALFPHLNVAQNIGFGKDVSCNRVEKLLEMMELQQIAKKRIVQLSGGQAQRVAIARALARNPKLLILDEPFNALDAKIKNKIIDELNVLQKELGFVMMVVSHEISELYRLSDRIWEVDQGKVIAREIQTSPPKDHFILEVEVLKIDPLYAWIEVLFNEEVCRFACNPAELAQLKAGEKIKVMIRSLSFHILR